MRFQGLGPQCLVGVLPDLTGRITLLACVNLRAAAIFGNPHKSKTNAFMQLALSLTSWALACR
jgi:hypothetical protein